MGEAVRRHLSEAWAEVEEVLSQEALEGVGALRRCLAWVEVEVLRCWALVGAAESISPALGVEEVLRWKWEVVVVGLEPRSQGKGVQVATKMEVKEAAAGHCLSAAVEAARAPQRFSAVMVEVPKVCLAQEVVEGLAPDLAVAAVGRKARDFL